MNTLDKLQSNHFLTYLNLNFYIQLEGGESIGLELVSITESGRGSSPDARSSFSLEFLGPVSSQYLTQRTHRLEHEEMGALDLFLVPLGPVSGRMRYEVIFT